MKDLSVVTCSGPYYGTVIKFTIALIAIIGNLVLWVVHVLLIMMAIIIIIPALWQNMVC